MMAENHSLYNAKEREKFMDTNMVLTITSTIIGSGGLATLITAILSSRKYKAEANSLEQQIETARLESEQKTNEYIRSQLKELSETHKRESDELRNQNKELFDKIASLNDHINQLMTWIVVDNNSYRTWLENELRKLNPTIEFPRCRPAPGFNTFITTDDTTNSVV